MAQIAMFSLSLFTMHISLSISSCSVSRCHEEDFFVVVLIFQDIAKIFLHLREFRIIEIGPCISLGSVLFHDVVEGPFDSLVQTLIREMPLHILVGPRNGDIGISRPIS